MKRVVRVEPVTWDLLDAWKKSKIPLFPIMPHPVAVCRNERGKIDAFMGLALQPHRAPAGLYIAEPIFCKYGRQILRMMDILETELRRMGAIRYLVYLDSAHLHWLKIINRVPEFKLLGRSEKDDRVWYERSLT